MTYLQGCILMPRIYIYNVFRLKTSRSSSSMTVILVERCKMIIIVCAKRNVNLQRMISYVTFMALLVSAFIIYIVFHWQTSSLQEPSQRHSNAQLGVSTSGTVSSSTSSSSPPLPCDEECRRFRRLLDIWPADKPKAAVILLLRPSSIGAFARSSRLFNANFNDAYHYPVIVFHEENMNNNAHRQRLRSLTNSSLYFQVRCRPTG